MIFSESKELIKEKLHLACNSIYQTTCWNDLVDSMSVHAYITRSTRKEMKPVKVLQKKPIE
jgi:hypothetical protein